MRHHCFMVAEDRFVVRSPENVAIGYEPAGLASRTLAFLLDLVVVVVLIGVVDVVVAAIATSAGARESPATVLLLAGGVPFGALIGYFLVAETATQGRSLGKRAVGLRVLRADGGAPGAGEALIRNLARIVDVTVVGPVVMFLDRQGRRLGDLAAGTVVVRERFSAAAPQVAVVRTPDAGPPIDHLERLGTSEHAVLRTFLSRPGLSPGQRQRLAQLLAEKLFARLDLPPEAPERSWPAELFVERCYLQLAVRLEAGS